MISYFSSWTRSNIFSQQAKNENEPKHLFKKGNFFLEGGAIAPNAPLHLPPPIPPPPPSYAAEVPYIYKELIRRIMTFEYEKLLLLKSMQNKVETNIVIIKQNKAS